MQVYLRLGLSLYVSILELFSAEPALRQANVCRRGDPPEEMCRSTFTVWLAAAAYAGEQQDPEQAVTASAVTEAIEAEQSAAAASAAIVGSAAAAGAKNQ